MVRQDKGMDRVATLDTAFDIIESLRMLESATLDDLTDELDVAKSTIHRHVTTLHDRGYVVRKENEYILSLQFLNLGYCVQTSNEVYVLAKPKVEELADRTNERAQFVVEQNGRAVYPHMKAGEHAVTTDTHVGKHTPIHASAGGLAILAYFDESRVVDIVKAHGLKQITPHTITDQELLFEELEQIRERGYSINNQGHIQGLRAIGAPVRGPDNTVVGALSISGPTNRFQRERLEEDLPNLLLGSTNELELNLAYQ